MAGSKQARRILEWWAQELGRETVLSQLTPEAISAGMERLAKGGGLSGRPLAAGTVRRQFNVLGGALSVATKAREAAQVEDFRFHDLRHTFASYLAMSGATLAELAEALGHRSLTMVKRYAHLTEGHTVAVVARMTQRFMKKKPTSQTASLA